VTHRTREIGIRLAMGAQPPDVLRIIAGQAVRLMVLGLTVGVASAAVFARIVSSMLFGVSPADAPVYAAATGGMVVIAAAAVAVPALRALRVDPAITLRED
jgi:putative ABC transport system permease protein